MAPFYKLVCEQLGWPVDAAKLAAMEKVNAAELESRGEKIKTAEENEGESEIREAYLARADFLMRTGEKEKALEAYEPTHASSLVGALKSAASPCALAVAGAPTGSCPGHLMTYRRAIRACVVWSSARGASS